MTSSLIIGATRGLGAALVKQYAAQSSSLVFATTRSGAAPGGFPDGVKWLRNIDLTKSNVGDSLTSQLKGEKPLDVVVRCKLGLKSRFNVIDFVTSRLSTLGDS